MVAPIGLLLNANIAPWAARRATRIPHAGPKLPRRAPLRRIGALLSAYYCNNS